MAHRKCLRCRSRVWRDGAVTDRVDDLCPGCGDPLEDAADVSELLGLRLLGPRPGSVQRQSADRSARISQQIRETIAHNDAERRRRIDAERT